MKTAMQQAIEMLRRINLSSTLDTADILEKEYLPKEREQIERAWFDGVEYIESGIGDKNASDYFTQTYNTHKQ